MSLYLYLNEHWHAETWMFGGVIPINPASTYRKMERSGIYTPDENLIHDSPVDLTTPNPLFRLSPGAQVKGLTMCDNYVDGVRQPDVFNASYYEEDGLILSFSRRLSRNVAKKMSKTACIKILDMSRLKAHLDEQLGVTSKAGFCEYTSGHQRNHFLKSEADMWQDEYRLFWSLHKKVEVEIPPGIGELMRKW
ncbi:hypothetical protein [Pseudomonas sp. NUPR-001]|uniref:hypothetical protein n=1 Tax=Pseudomonas sp. NUPR-001 TaxID=3416058 RepID=UPI003F9ACA85